MDAPTTPRPEESVRKRLVNHGVAVVKKVKLEPKDDDAEDIDCSKPQVKLSIKKDEDVTMLGGSEYVESLAIANKHLVTPRASSLVNPISKDEEVTLVGIKNELRLPHMRQHCMMFPFQPDTVKANHGKNLLYCDTCYCYVCDVPVAQCSTWDSHCAATDTGKHASYYKGLRQDVRNKKEAKNNPCILSTPKAPAPALTYTTKETPPNVDQSKCQHCHFENWYSKKPSDPDNGGQINYLYDYCKQCGRIVSSAVYATVQEPFAPCAAEEETGLVALGQKTLGFRLHPNQPDQHDLFVEYWKRQKKSCDRQTEANETYQYLIGKRPNLLRLMQAISSTVRETETRVIVLKDLNQLNMLSSLLVLNQEFGDSGHEAGRSRRMSCLVGDIVTKIDSKTLEGVSEELPSSRPTYLTFHSPVARQLRFVFF